MNKILSITLSLVTCYLLLVAAAPVAHAHILKSDGSIGAVLHVDPNDDPIAGEVSTFFFELKDTENKFDASDCICTFRVLSNGKELYKESTQSDGDTLSGSYTFPSKNIYQVEVSGTSHTKSFESFRLAYDIRVERTTTNVNAIAPPENPKFNYMLLVPVVIIMLAVIIGMNRLSKRR